LVPAAAAVDVEPDALEVLEEVLDPESDALDDALLGLEEDELLELEALPSFLVEL
jgi:hypothetical protein